MFNRTMISASAMYPNAMMGTMMLLTLAMRCTPPKMIVSVSAVMIRVSYTHLDVYKRQVEWGVAG